MAKASHSGKSLPTESILPLTRTIPCAARGRNPPRPLARASAIALMAPYQRKGIEEDLRVEFEERDRYDRHATWSIGYDLGS